MTLTDIIFLVFAGLTATSGVVLALTRRLMYAGFLLFIVLFGMAALFVFAGAEFLAVTQVIVYVGGILILVLFGVMLTQKQRGEVPKTEMVNILPGGIAATGLLAGFIYLIRTVQPNDLPWMRAAEPVKKVDVNAIGVETVTDYLLPFEAISILLLVALIGAAYLARKSQSTTKAS